MKILFCNRPKASWIGGDYVQMEKTAQALRDLGHEVEISEQNIYLPAENFPKFDVIHLWNFSMEWTKPQIGVALIHKKPTVCSMIYHQTDKYVTYPEQRFMADKLDKAIFLNEGELKRFRKKIKIYKSKIEFLTNGIDKEWFKRPKKGSYALTVGRISEFKGQLAVAKACKALKIPYHLVGEPENEEYLAKCVKEGAIYRGVLQGEELIKEYEGCSVYVLASKNELMPLTVMEAGAMAKPIVLTTGSEWKPDVTYCKYNGVSSIKSAILKAKGNLKLRDELAKMTWENVAKKLESIYLCLTKEAHQELGKKTPTKKNMTKSITSTSCHSVKE